MSLFKKTVSILVFAAVCTAVSAAPWSTFGPKRKPETLIITANYVSPRLMAELIQYESGQPYLLLPATTALGSIMQGGREMGLRAGANVVMPNLSPSSVRAKYTLYNNKLSTGTESAQALMELSETIRSVGYRVVKYRGDIKKENTNGKV